MLYFCLSNDDQNNPPLLICWNSCTSSLHRTSGVTPLTFGDRQEAKENED
jgi:hypothetical protein